MNVLLIGGSNSFSNELIRKLKKEGNRVSVLTGSHFNREFYERVFERYDFPYDSDCILEVFESVVPDVTIFMGAYDSNFPRSGAQSMTVRFISGLMNVLIGFSSLRRGRFYYLSSEEAFEGKDDAPITETMNANASDYRGMAVAQGEELCESFRHNRGVDIVTVRIGGCYHLPTKLAEVDSIVPAMCLQALSERHINAREHHSMTLLDQSDAVEFLARIIKAEEHRHSVYQLSTGEAVTEAELAERVCRIFSEKERSIAKEKRAPARVIPITEAGERYLCLDNTRYREEFGINRFNDLDKRIGDISEYMLRHEGVFLQDKPEKLPWWKRFLQRFGGVIHALLPFLENMIAFIPFFMLNNRATDSQYFAKLDFYLLYVLLFAIVYGQQQAAFSAILATGGYLFRQMYNRSGFEVLLDYNTYIWIAQLFILGLVVGYMKDRLKAQKEEAREDHAYMIGQIDDIKEINSSNVRVKDAMETQIINQSDSVGKIYEITSSLGRYNYDEVLFYAAEILEQIMGTEDVAIYTVANATYARLFTATSAKARSLGNSIRYPELAGLYDELCEHRVFINKKLDDGLPMMAAGIYDNDELSLIVMIWTLPWEKMTLGQANILAVTSALIQNAALRAHRYLAAMERERFIGDTPILKQEAFMSILEAYQNAQDRSLTEFSALKIETEGRDVIEVGCGVSKKLRPNDYVGELRGGGLYVLLTNTDRQGAAAVAERLRKAGFPCRLPRTKGTTKK